MRILDVPYLQSERLNALLTRIVGQIRWNLSFFIIISMRQISCTVMKNLGILKEYLDEKFA